MPDINTLIAKTTDVFADMFTIAGTPSPMDQVVTLTAALAAMTTDRNAQAAAVLSLQNQLAAAGVTLAAAQAATAALQAKINAAKPFIDSAKNALA